MKAIMVMFDTLNRHMLPPYGCDWVHAPNFERLATRTVTYDHAYVASMPCMPARRELHTGRYNFLHRSWGPLEPYDDSMPQILKENGVYTHLATDHQHYFEDGGASYHQRYSSWHFSRGQEGDFWHAEVADPEIPPVAASRAADGSGGAAINESWRQDWINRKHITKEADQPQSVTFANGLEFIRANHEQNNWFLQIETFDPHEPFFTQQKYKELYPHEYEGDHFDWPPYRPVDETEAEVQHVRYEYAALVSMCDENLGKVLDMMDELNMWDDTLLIVNTDHGFLLGEHDWWAKVMQPFYNEVAHVPLFIWDPRSRVTNERRSGLVQMIDMPATLLEFFNVALPKAMQGIPLRDSIAADAPVHDAALFGVHGGHVNVTDGRYVYMRAPAKPDNGPLFEYTLMPTHMRGRFTVEELQDIQLAEPFAFTKGCRTIKVRGRPWVDAFPFGTMLFDVEIDPGQKQPLDDPEAEQKMIREMIELMKANDSPPEQFDRLGLL